MVLPLVGCGTVIGADASRWLRGDLELFSPRGLSGVFGFHFFLLVPLLNVYWDEWRSTSRCPRTSGRGSG